MTQRRRPNSLSLLACLATSLSVVGCTVVEDDVVSDSETGASEPEATSPEEGSVAQPASPHRAIPACDTYDEACCPAGMTVVPGTSGDDNLSGGSSSQCLVGFGGDDQLTAGSAGDYLICGPGVDQCDGDSGPDVIYGGLDRDVIDAGSADDLVDAGEGDNEVDLGSGNDECVSGSGADEIDGESGNDVIQAGAGDDVVKGGTGNDEIHGGFGGDHLQGESGADTLIGGPGLDYVEGGSGNDTVIIHDLCEVVSGETYEGNSGNDTLITPVDVATLENTYGVTVEDFENVNVVEAPELSECKFGHPLRGVELIGGQAPGVDIHTSPAGKRYAIVSGEHHGPGGVQTISGVVELDVETLSTAELGAIMQEKIANNGGVDPTPPIIQPQVVAPSLAAVIAEASPTTPVAVLIRLTSDAAPAITDRVRAGIAHGAIGTIASWHSERAQYLADKQQRILAAQGPLIAAIQAAAGAVTYQCQNLWCLAAILPAGEVDGIAQRPDVARLDLPGIAENEEAACEDATQAQASGFATGGAIREGLQLKQFLDDGHDGSVGASSPLAPVIVETQDFDWTHPAFVPRVIDYMNCTGAGCTSSYAPPTPDDFFEIHATGVAGVLLGDSGQVASSGFAPGSTPYFYTVDSGTTAWGLTTLDHINNLPGQPAALVNYSMGLDRTSGVWDQCNGDDTPSQNVNELFKDGLAFFKSAGNEGDDVECTVSSPGSAMGAFTVANYSRSVNATAKSVRTQQINSNSSVGAKSWFFGRSRTIVDIAAYGQHSRKARPGGLYSTCMDGTSGAAPVVAAAALELIDFDVTVNNDWTLATDPAALYTELLLMGDRRGEFFMENRMRWGYSPRWGAGRLKMRKFDDRGMDNSWGHERGRTCISQGEIHWVTLQTLVGGPVPADVDDFRVVAWWYDERHQTDGQVSDVDLILELDGVQTGGTSLSALDNKERIYTTETAGKVVRVGILGHSRILGHDAVNGCPADTVAVYWDVMWEDGARDDDEGPCFDSFSGVGIECDGAGFDPACASTPNCGTL